MMPVAKKRQKHFDQLEMTGIIYEAPHSYECIKPENIKSFSHTIVYPDRLLESKNSKWKGVHSDQINARTSSQSRV